METKLRTNFAIIIPYYKIAFFEATLQSLENQTNKRFKVYIGDDASPENPSDILKKYSDSFTFKYKRFAENLGGISLVHQWERCIDLIDDEEWLMILGDDDVLSENIVEEFYNNIVEIERRKSSVIRFSTQIIDRYSKIISVIYTHPTIEFRIDFINRKFSNETRSSLSEYIFKVDTLRAIGFVDFPLAWHSDDLAVFLFSLNRPIITVNQAVVYVRVSNESITGSGDNGQNLQLKSLATQEFILNYASKFKGLKVKTINSLDIKLQNAYFNSSSKKFLIKILFRFIKSFKWYQFSRFTYLLIKYRLNARN